jgi:putative transposase
MQDQKLEYIHVNPVKEGYVWLQEDYVYSSASFYAGRESVMGIDPIG